MSGRCGREKRITNAVHKGVRNGQFFARLRANYLIKQIDFYELHNPCEIIYVNFMHFPVIRRRGNFEQIIGWIFTEPITKACVNLLRDTPCACPGASQSFAHCSHIPAPFDIGYCRRVCGMIKRRKNGQTEIRAGRPAKRKEA